MIYISLKLKSIRRKNLKYGLSEKLPIVVYRDTHLEQKSIWFDPFSCKSKVQNDRNYVLKKKGVYLWSPTYSYHELDFYQDKAYIFSSVKELLDFCRDNNTKELNILVLHYYTEIYNQPFDTFFKDLRKLVN